ncbi:CCE_0567 family metalloprotein [Mesorhizobium sp. ArgA1]
MRPKAGRWPIEAMNLNATDANSDRRRGYFSASLDDDLRDLAKDLPVGWRRIRAVAEKTFDVFCRVGRQGEKLAAWENSR